MFAEGKLQLIHIEGDLFLLTVCT